MSLRDRLAERIRHALWGHGDRANSSVRSFYADVEQKATHAALSVLAEGIEIVTPHNDSALHGWFVNDDEETLKGISYDSIVLRCCFFPKCKAEARIPEALLVSLVEAADG